MDLRLHLATSSDILDQHARNIHAAPASRAICGPARKAYARDVQEEAVFSRATEQAGNIR